MLVLHAAWLPTTAAAPAGLALWAEVVAPARARRGPLPKSAAPHPFAASHAVLTPLLLPELLEEPCEPLTLIARLPTAGGEPRPSRPFLREAARPGPVTLRGWRVPALVCRPVDSLALLISLSGDTPGLDLGAGAGYWQAVARFALQLLTQGQYVPALAGNEGETRAFWRPLLELPPNEASFKQLLDAMPSAARALARAARDPEPAPRALLSDCLEQVVDGFARRQALAARRIKGRARSPGEVWLRALGASDPAVDLPADFLEAYTAWSQPAAVNDSNFRLCLRLDPPEARVGEDLYVPKARTADWLLRYFLQANDDPSLLVPAEQVWRERGSALKFLNRKFDQPQERLLAGLGLAARLFPPIEDSLTVARPEASALTAVQAHAFVREAALLLQAAGFGVLLPGLSTKLGVRLKLGSRRQTKAPQGGVTRLAFENVIAFDWELALGDQPLDREEFEKLAALKVPLVQIRGQWVEVQPEQLQRALDFLKNHELAGEIALDEALRLALAPDGVAGLPVVAVETAGWFGDMLAQLGDQARLVPLPPPPGFVGRLRPYQATGFAWLAFLRQFGFGACLADDMGLGKTIQTIALLLHLRAAQGRQARPALLVCPTSVMDNWRREVARFAPELRVRVHHGLGRVKDDFARDAEQHDLVVTSYALLHRDEQWLAGVEWGELILDEAQNIKNPDTRQAQTARRLRAAHRIALTGTPVENRLTELWSIFQFLNPGYLGAQSAFRSNFANPIERLQDPLASSRLKSLVGPFILRRVKSDPTVISDLPAKNEMKVFCTLTREQVTLYEAVVRDSLKQIEESEGIQRRGLVLATLLKLKQVCNHPAHFLGDGGALADRSGKLIRLVEMLEEVTAVRERALIFTQFSEMGTLLKRHLQTVLGDEVLFLYGGTPVAARAKMVERFQSDPHGPPVLVLSIKAGGTGLNLTRANHVFHFDRWWNPAVENQATDRAFRIGQTKNVQVFKYVCAGTVEERIDEMIERKLALAQSIIGVSEAWISELSTEQLRDIFTLRAEAVA